MLHRMFRVYVTCTLSRINPCLKAFLCDQKTRFLLFVQIIFILCVEAYFFRSNLRISFDLWKLFLEKLFSITCIYESCQKFWNLNFYSEYVFQCHKNFFLFLKLEWWTTSFSFLFTPFIRIQHRNERFEMLVSYVPSPIWSLLLSWKLDITSVIGCWVDILLSRVLWWKIVIKNWSELNL